MSIKKSLTVGCRETFSHSAAILSSDSRSSAGIVASTPARVWGLVYGVACVAKIQNCGHPSSAECGASAAAREIFSIAARATGGIAGSALAKTPPGHKWTFAENSRKVDARLPGKGNPDSHVP